MNDENYLVVMAGGIGSRFWPASRQANPKQFQDILGTGASLLQQTVKRFSRVCSTDNIYVVTNKNYGDLVSEQLPELSPDQILREPMQKNTSACIAYASNKIFKQNPNARIIVTPSDHAIFNETEFEATINTALEGLGDDGKLVTIGLRPHRPETGYGYIQYIEGDESLKKVKTFTEKPSHDLATKFIESGDFLWNSGLFIWKADSILDAFNEHLPELADSFSDIRDAYFTPKEQDMVDTAYSHSQNISIDIGVMEKASNVYVVPADFGWSDLGSWNSLHEISDKDDNSNVIDGNVLIYDSKNCLVKAPKDLLVVMEGLDGYLVAECGNALIICKKAHEKRFREFVNDVRNKKGTEFL